MADQLTDAGMTSILGAKCPDCGWRTGHRPPIPGMDVEACPRWTPEETTTP